MAIDDICTATMIAEGVEDATEEEVIESWQLLVDTVIVWQLQGFFGRTATDLIEQGIIKPAQKEDGNAQST